MWGSFLKPLPLAVLLLLVRVDQAKGELGVTLDDLLARHSNNTAALPEDLDPALKAQYESCYFDVNKFNSETTPHGVLIKCFLKLSWESIDYEIDNQLLNRRFDYFNKKWRTVKRENQDLRLAIEETSAKLLTARNQLREERMDYAALLVALKLEYNDLTSRAEMHTRFGSKSRTYLTQEEIMRENELAQKSNDEQEKGLAMLTAVGAHAEKQAEAERNGEAPVAKDAEEESPAEEPDAEEESPAEEPDAEEESPAEPDEGLRAVKRRMAHLRGLLGELEVRSLHGTEDSQAPNLGEDPPVDGKVMTFNRDYKPPASLVVHYAKQYEADSQAAVKAAAVSAAANAEFLAASSASSALTAAVESGMPTEELTAAVAQQAAKRSATALNALQKQKEKAEEAAAELQAATQAANDACVQAEEEAAANPDDEGLKEAKRVACEKADELANEAALSANSLRALESKVEQAQATSESNAAISAKAAKEDGARAAEGGTAQVEAAQNAAKSAGDELEALKAKEPPLIQSVEEAEEALDVARNEKDDNNPHSVSVLKIRLKETIAAKTALSELRKKIAKAEAALGAAQEALGAAESKKAAAMKALVESSKEEETMASAMKESKESAELAKAAVAKAAANYDELMVQVEGAKVEMADARVDHADRGSSDSKAKLDHAVAEYDRLYAISKAMKAKLDAAKAEAALKMARLAEDERGAEVAAKMRAKLETQANPPKREKGPDPGSAAALKAQAEAEATAAAIAKAKAAAAAKAAQASAERAAKDAADAAAFAKAQAAAAASANEQRGKRRARLAMNDPSKMNPVILRAKMDMLVKEHLKLKESHQMLTERDGQIEKQYRDEKATFEELMAQYLSLSMSYDEVSYKLRAEIRKTSDLKPAIGGEGMCISCPVTLPDDPKRMLRANFRGTEL